MKRRGYRRRGIGKEGRMSYETSKSPCTKGGCKLGIPASVQVVYALLSETAVIHSAKVD